MNFCSNCGSNNLKKSIPEHESLPRTVCSSCNEIHYVNPKIIAGCLVVNRGKVMLCRRNIEPRYNLWNLPCGFMEMDESLVEAAVRETLEETEASVKIQHLHCTYSLPKHGQVYTIFLATMLDGHYAATFESSEVTFFSEEDIPWNEIAFDSTTYALKTYFNAQKSQLLGQCFHGEF
jgi:ADP-ribose pyrophosphatase YjhB (NUDIX family)